MYHRVTYPLPEAIKYFSTRLYRLLLRPLLLAGALAAAGAARAQTPTFAPVVPYATGPSVSGFIIQQTISRSIAVADVDRDSKPDLLTTNMRGHSRPRPAIYRTPTSSTIY